MSVGEREACKHMRMHTQTHSSTHLTSHTLPAGICCMKRVHNSTHAGTGGQVEGRLGVKHVRCRQHTHAHTTGSSIYFQSYFYLPFSPRLHVSFAEDEGKRQRLASRGEEVKKLEFVWATCWPLQLPFPSLSLPSPVSAHNHRQSA